MSNFMKIRSGLHLGSLASEPSGSEGMIYFNTTTKKFRRHDGASWKDIGSGAGSGTGDDLGSLTFKASFNETFIEIPIEANTAVDYSAGKTDANIYSAIYQYLRIAYDASKTVTGTGTSMTISGTPSFTVKAGDMLIVGSEVRRITVVTTQTQYTIDSSFTTNPSTAACNVSQCIYTKDLNNYSGDGLSPASAFGTGISQILLNYEETTADGDVIFDANTIPKIGYAASSDGSSYTSINSRSTYLANAVNITDLPSVGTNLYLRFFSVATSGTGFANLLKYKVFFHRDVSYQDGSLQNQSYCLTNGAGTEINCSAPFVVSGKTRVQLTWTYPINVNTGTQNGALMVFLNGQKIPRYVDATLTPSAYYKEIAPNLIELDSNYSAVSLSLDIIQTVAVIDSSETNSTSIAYLQEIQNQTFQGFVNTANTLIPTTTTGTPATGTFYSSISNRAPIVDITQDLKVFMGVERIMTQQIYPIQNESGPYYSSYFEQISGVVNDDAGRIRFVGDWRTTTTTNGTKVLSSSSFNTVDYVEITFYGTGLNMLSVYDGTVQNTMYSINGGSEITNIHPASNSSVLSGRNYNPNNVVKIVSGLTLGVYTITLRNNSSTVDTHISGFEILNESTSLKVNPGTSYANNKKLITESRQTIPYNSSFETGTLGTRGGRVVVYQKADGTIAKAVQPVNASSANFTSADHTNEEIARNYHWREFGAGRTDDFSLSYTTGAALAFTLDDGTTTLVGNNVLTNSTQTLGIGTTAGSFISITFVGTGLDVIELDRGTGASTTYTVSVDGTSIGTTTGTGNGRFLTQKIVSGLPYGTHTVKIAWTSGVGYSIAFSNFIIYQPKKPTVPSGTVELADYNIMAAYSTNVAYTSNIISTGVLRKALSARETQYAGTWTAPSVSTTNFDNGLSTPSTASASTATYTFFGTGFELRSFAPSLAGSYFTVTVDGSTNLSSYTTNSILDSGGLMTFTPATGVVANGNNSRYYLKVTGMSLGMHTVKFTTNSVSNFYVDAFDVITPIHSHKSNLSYDVLNTLPIGSQAISDNRKVKAIKDSIAKTKNVSQAFGISSNPTTTSTTPVPMPDMSAVINASTGMIRVSYSATLHHGTLNNDAGLVVYVDGIQVGRIKTSTSSTATARHTISDVVYVPVSPGIHKVDLYWFAESAGTVTARNDYRSLLVEEI